MSTPAETVQSFLADVFDANGINVDRIDNHFSADCIFHDALPGLEGLEGYKTLMAIFNNGTEALGGATQPLVIAEGDIVAIRWINRFKHTGELMGIPASGRVVHAKGHEFYRVQDGKIVENWGIMDMAGIVAQITDE